MKRRVCVFCGSRSGIASEFEEAARLLGNALSLLNIGLVYGGGRTGLMGILADSVLLGGGEVIGIMPSRLCDREEAHEHLSMLHIVDTIHERRERMYEVSDCFLGLPGGLGTFEELFETLSWNYLGIHSKPCGVLNIRQYFDPFMRLIENAVEAGFAGPESLTILQVETDPAILVNKLFGNAR